MHKTNKLFFVFQLILICFSIVGLLYLCSCGAEDLCIDRLAGTFNYTLTLVDKKCPELIFVNQDATGTVDVEADEKFLTCGENDNPVLKYDWFLDCDIIYVLKTVTTATTISGTLQLDAVCIEGGIGRILLSGRSSCTDLYNVAFNPVE